MDKENDNEEYLDEKIMDYINYMDRINCHTQDNRSKVGEDNVVEMNNSDN